VNDIPTAISDKVAAVCPENASSDVFSFTKDCKTPPAERCTSNAKPVLKDAADEKFLDLIEHAHFNYFVDQSDPNTGLTKDRSADYSPASVAAVGFSLTTYPIAAERGWVSRAEAADYSLKVLRTLWNVPQGEDATGENGSHGFFYHFLDPKTGTRMWNSEVSTIDTALLMSGVLFVKDYFNGTSKEETEIRDLADKLYKRVDWPWMLNSQKRLSNGWTPEDGFTKWDWQGYNEAMILHILGLGSPTHPLPPDVWKTFTSTEKVRTYGGQTYIDFPPQFGHQYSHSWVDFRGIMDAKNKSLGFDYFENSRRATLAQNYYGIINPNGFRSYSNLDWGWTASDGPGSTFDRQTATGAPLKFRGYSDRGAPDYIDDGTIAPTAVAASIAFAPDVVLKTLKYWSTLRPELWSNDGFKDAFNPTAVPKLHSGWIDPDLIGIDQGPVVLMTENYRTGLVWNTMKNDKYLVQGLKKAGFTGSWLDCR